MDRDWYINERLRQLNDPTFYRPLDDDITDDIQKRSMYTQIWNMVGQRPNLQLLQKERSLHSRVWKKMRSRQRIHGMQDTAPSLELRIRNSGEASAPVNIDRTGRGNERDNSKNKTRHGSTGEHVTPLNIRKWFKPRSSIPWLKKTIWVIGVLRRTVVNDWRFDNLCGYDWLWRHVRR